VRNPIPFLASKLHFAPWRSLREKKNNSEEQQLLAINLAQDPKLTHSPRYIRDLCVKFSLSGKII
jgi:hypothetical protein